MTICLACGSPRYHRNDDIGGSIAPDLLALAAELAHCGDIATAQSLGATMLAIGAAALADEPHEHPTMSQNVHSATRSDGSSEPWTVPDPTWVAYRCSNPEDTCVQRGRPGHEGETCEVCESGTLLLYEGALT